jgi:hypothetical protein
MSLAKSFLPEQLSEIVVRLRALPASAQSEQFVARIERLADACNRVEPSRPLLPIARSLLWSATIALFSVGLLLVGGTVTGLIAALLLAVLALLPQERPLLAAWDAARKRLPRIDGPDPFKLSDADHVAGPLGLLLIGGVREREMPLVTAAPTFGRTFALLGAASLAISAILLVARSGSPLLIVFASATIAVLAIAAALREGRAAEEAILLGLLRASEEPAHRSIELLDEVAALRDELDALTTEAAGA